MATARTIVLLTAILSWAGCSDISPTDPTEGVGPVVARYVLTEQDGAAPPCCVVDSSNVQITVVGGSLIFHGPAGYADTTNTPAGSMSRACVHGVPNGANVNTFTHIITLPDSTSYLQLPCDRGTYTLVVMRQLHHADGSFTTDSVTVSSGRFTAAPDIVDLADSHSAGSFTSSVTGATIVVTGPAHQYRFDPEH